MKHTVRGRSWVVSPRPNSAARLRLFCLPYAGGTASVFRTWTDGLRDLEVCSIQLPGREDRLKETPYTDARPLIEALGQELIRYRSTPMAIFGHSLGAVLAFELVRHLRARFGLEAVHLFVSGQQAPHLLPQDPPIFHLSDHQFLDEVQRRYGGVPQEVRDNSAFLQLLLTPLRADFTINDTYTYVPGEPLKCPITCFGGLEDRDAKVEQLNLWREHTTGPFRLRMFPGDHFFLRSAQSALLQAISTDINAALERE